jgi:hypothetical protein
MPSLALITNVQIPNATEFALEFSKVVPLRTTSEYTLLTLRAAVVGRGGGIAQARGLHHRQRNLQRDPHLRRDTGPLVRAERRKFILYYTQVTAELRC